MAFEMALLLQTASCGVKCLTLLDGSHSYVAAHTGKYKEKLTPGNEAQAESEALCAFVLQFAAVDYSKVRTFNCHKSLLFYTTAHLHMHTRHHHICVS